MQDLNLPSFQFKTKIIDGKQYIFDILRKKHIILTPEEWVRQHFIHFLINNYNYPKPLIKTEGGLRVNAMLRRSDLLVFDRSANPFLLLECKAPSVKITQNAFDQVAAYNTQIKATHLAVSNGLEHFICKIDFENHAYRFLQDFPPIPAV